MTADRDDTSPTDAPPTGSAHTAPITAATILTEAIGRIRREPLLVVPFALTGGLVSLADWLREHDSIPATSADALEQSVSVQYSIFPSGTARTGRSVGALVDLHRPYFLWGVGLELVVFLAVGLAGWVTIHRAVASGVAGPIDGNRNHRSLGRYLLALLALAVLPRLFGASSLTIDNLLLGVAVLAAIAFVLVRLFLVPVYLVTGCGLVTALRRSRRGSRGWGQQVFGLILVFGLASWGLAHVPVAGGFLSTALVAPIHAVSLAVIHQRGPRDDRSN